MKNNKILAIRCLAYNHERTIRQCLEGFVNQKTKLSMMMPPQIILPL